VSKTTISANGEGGCSSNKYIFVPSLFKIIPKNNLRKMLFKCCSDLKIYEKIKDD